MACQLLHPTSPKNADCLHFALLTIRLLGVSVQGWYPPWPDPWALLLQADSVMSEGTPKHLQPLQRARQTLRALSRMSEQYSPKSGTSRSESTNLDVSGRYMACQIV